MDSCRNSRRRLAQGFEGMLYLRIVRELSLPAVLWKKREVDSRRPEEGAVCAMEERGEAASPGDEGCGVICALGGR